MKIGIDARFYGPVGKGLGRYTQEVVDNLLRINSSSDDEAFDYVIFLSPENYDSLQCDSHRVRKVRIDIPWYSWREQLFFPFLIWRERLDLMHFPHFNVPIFTPVKFVVTIHDLILTKFPTLRATTRSAWVYFLKNAAYKLVISQAVRRARRIISVSNFTKQDLIDKFGVDDKKIVVTYEGVANLLKGKEGVLTAESESRDIIADYGLNHLYLLYVGNAYPHKNLDFLLRVFSNFRKQFPDSRLVLVGKRDFFYDRIRESAKSLNLWQDGQANSPVIFPGYVSDECLEALYSSARAYVFPSLYEGFGLPPLEAMSRRCPVLSSDRSSMPEILGNAALYFNPESEVDFLQKLNLIFTDDSLRESLVARGQEIIKRYNWRECAKDTLLAYKSCL